MKAKFEQVPDALKDLVRGIGHFADEKKAALYLVGGSVRDIILGESHADLDFVVEGDGIAFAESYAQKKRARIIVHRRFGTATLWLSESHKVDSASARCEVYESPGALPIVAPGTIHDDLFRRDFTINAMAMCVNDSRFGELVDDFGGQSDLKGGIVRALHSLSFFDDPTRILRAVRFEQRFGFDLDKNTLADLREAVRSRMLHKVGKHRLRDELVLIFKEPDPFRALERLGYLAGLSFIAPGLARSTSWRREFSEAKRAMKAFKSAHPKKHLEPAMTAFLLFFARLSYKEAKAVMFDFAFHRAESAALLSLIRQLPAAKNELCRRSLRPSAVYRILESLRFEAVLLLPILLRSDQARRHVTYFLEWSAAQRLHLKGEDLKALGLKPGPRYKEILRDLLSAKIDNDVESREDEVAWVKCLVTKG
jgi:tRNA nucleotidyltransferase (CCA-adding enzyme)